MKKSVLFVIVVAVTSICSGQWLERQVVLGDTFGGIGYPGKLVVNPVSGNVYIRSGPIQVFNPATMEKMRGPGVSGQVVFCPPDGKGYVVRETLLIINAAADTVIGRAILPFRPRDFAYGRTSNRLYLGSTNDSGLLVFDPSHDSVVKTIAMGRIWSLAWDSVWNRLYVGTFSNSDPRSPLKILDCDADTLLPDLELGFEYWYDLVVSPVSHKLYCTGTDTTGRYRLLVVSTDSLKPIDTVPGLPRVGIAAYSPLKDWLYFRDDQTIYVVDCRNDSIRASCDLGVSVSATVASSLTGKVYLGDDDSARVLVMDTTSSVAAIIRLPGDTRVWTDAMAFSADRNQVYGATAWDGVAFAVDATSDTLAGWVSYQRQVPSHMIHNPAGNKLYLICEGTDDILVFDTTFADPKRIPCSMYAADAVLNQALNRLYVITSYDLRVIDCNSDSIIESRDLPGLYHPLPVLVPYLNKLYLFSADPDSVYAYDCLTGMVSSVLYLTTPVTGALYDARSNRVFFSCGPAPTVRALDPVTDEVVKTFDLVSTPFHGRMAVNVDLGRLYYTDQLPTRLFTIDVMADSVIGSESLPWGVEGLFLDRRLGKLFMCGTDPARALVYDCSQRAIVDTIDVGYDGAGLMNERNDKLYLSHGAVVDCRYDSVVARLESVSMSCMAWDQIDNRVFQATSNSRLLVYRDELSAVADKPIGTRTQRLPTIVRGVLFLPEAASPKLQAASLLDISGRKVLDLRPGANNVRALAPGVYFVREAHTQAQVQVVRKVVVTR